MLNRQCRKTLRRLSAHAVAVLLLGAFASSQEVAAEVGSIAPLRLHWELISADASITVAHGGSLAAMKLTNSGDGPLSGQHWAIYFTCLEGVETGPLTGGLAIDRVVGALFRLRPTADFIALEPGKTLRVTLVHPGAIINLSQAPENPYLVPDEARDAGLPILDYTIGAFPAAPGARTAEYAYTRNAGIVTSVWSNQIAIYTNEGDVDVYYLRKYARSNQDTCINQVPTASHCAAAKKPIRRYGRWRFR